MVGLLVHQVVKGETGMLPVIEEFDGHGVWVKNQWGCNFSRHPNMENRQQLLTLTIVKLVPRQWPCFWGMLIFLLRTKEVSN